MPSRATRLAIRQPLASGFAALDDGPMLWGLAAKAKAKYGL